MTFANTEPPRIKSFVQRKGRVTLGQKFALENHAQQYCLDPKIDVDFTNTFGNDAPLIIEIGFGNGDSLAKTAAKNPDKNYLGIEVHRPGVGHLLVLIEEMQLTNIRIYCHDAIEILEQRVPNASVTGLHLFFPDPWHKKKHFKRRIVRDSFVELLAQKLAPNGYFHAATDWENYAEWMLEILNRAPNLGNLSTTLTYCDRPEYRPLTKFEQRGIRLGHGVWDVMFSKC
ncbi:MAG: tRNA (guanosine(46)-N7)-methyltransferase TrmB [Methylococcaceae bacterium]|nr:tRNA (guanosine(46)-N7)-methyltransferase TrmB [Methylococcaceae bacterium]